MKPLKITISGVRGIVGETFTPELIIAFSQAFGTYTDGGKVIIARDTRVSGEMVRFAVMAGLISAGCEVVDLGICPTPTLQLAVETTDARGGIAITASHNSNDWNALMFIRSDGIYLNSYQGEELLDVYHEGEFRKVSWSDLKPAITDETAISRHLSRILDSTDIASVRKRKFRVAIDCCNGAGSLVTEKFLRELGCEVVAINNEPNGIFPHDPEPIASNLGQLSQVVKENSVDIGFAQDADADRLAIVSGKGEPIGEDYTLALCTEFVLRKKPGLVVISLSTTRAIDDIAKKYKSTVVRTRVGDVNVTEYLKDNHGVIGGEGNGGVVVPEIHYAQDSFVAIATILQFMTITGQSISELKKLLPAYHIIKKKVACPPQKVHTILDGLREFYRNDKVDLLDGIRMERGNSWIHIRLSNTEPVMRVISESADKREAEALSNSALKEIRKYL